MKKFEISLLVGLVVAIFIGSITSFAADCDRLRGDVLRLHILANSDSAEDQALKLKVRDRVLKEMERVFEYPDTLDEAKESAASHLNEVQRIAEDELAKNGCSLPVKTEVVNMYFTTRQYETFTLPAGRYDAVRITIGKAEGKNWWCVLYPPLCLPAAQPGEAIEAALDENEAELVTSDPRYEIRFALVEWFEQLKSFFGL